MVAKDESIDYVGYKIDLHAVAHPGESFCRATITAADLGRVQFVEIIDSVYRDIVNAQPPADDDEFLSWVLSRTGSRAMAAIALDRVSDMDGQKFVYQQDEERAASQPDNDVQMLILSSLRRLRRFDPQHLGMVPFPATGICLVANVRKDELDYNEQRLRDREWTEAFAMGWDEHTYNLRITELGLQSLDMIEMSAQQSAAPAVDIRSASEDSSVEYFVAHEFSPDQVDDLRNAIDLALEGSGLSPYYADTELRQGHIFIDKILPRIRSCQLGIYEVSNSAKPNVFLELGAAIALGRPYVIIIRKGQPVPADLHGLDRIRYTSYKDLTAQLKGKIGPYLAS